MKKASLLVIVVLFYNIIFSQDTLPNPIYHDALYLKTNYNGGQINLTGDVKLLLGKYYGDPNAISADTLNQNPYFAGIFKDGGEEGLTELSGAGAIKSLGGIDVTNFANALADILMQHAREELTVTFFNKFKRFVDAHEEFKVLFPVTTGNLERLLSYKYREMLPALRSGFFEDLKQLTFHLDDVLELPKYRELLRDFPEIRLTVQILRILHEFQSGASNAADFIHDCARLEIVTENAASPLMTNISGGLKIADIISSGLRATKSADAIWVTPREIRDLFSGDIGFRLFAGLVYQECIRRKADFSINGKIVNFSTLMGEPIAMPIVRTKITEFIALAREADTALTALRHKSDSSDRTYQYIDASVNAIDYLVDFTRVFNDSIDTGHYLQIAKSSNNLYRDIYGKQYNQAVTDAFAVISGLATLAENRAKGDSVKLARKLTAFTQKAQPYALFMANVAAADSEEEIKAAFESIILPVGSSSIKKYSDFNLAVQSYVGARYATGRSYTGQSSWNDDLGVSVPVGIGCTFLGLKGGGAFSLFAPLIDIGAIVDYKLRESETTTADGSTVATTDKDYRIKLGQILSPGAFIVYGLPGNIPLSLGFGGQYGPGLSKISSAEGTIVNNPHWRWSVFLAVDIPLLNLRNHPKHTN